MASFWRGRDRFARRLSRMPDLVREEVGQALERQASQGAHLVELLAPKGEGGDLKGSVGWTKGFAPGSRKARGREALAAAGLVYTVYAGGQPTTKAVEDGESPTYDYANAAEHGTERQDKDPFFWPAARMLRKRRKSDVGKALRRAVKRSAGG